MRRKYLKSTLYWQTEQPAWPWKLFLAAEGILYLWFMIADIQGKTWLISSDVVKYVSIWGCFLMALYLYCSRQSSRCMLIAQAIILPADLILLFFDRAAWLGILLFLAVQICYFWRMRQTMYQYLRLRGNRLETGFGLSVLLLFLVLFAVLLLVHMPLSAEMVLALLYILVFFLNCILAVYEAFRFQKESGILFAVGMILFFLCDIHVGLFYLGSAMQPGSAAAWYADHVAALAMWLFYLPGQVLLVSSSVNRRDGWSVRK